MACIQKINGSVVRYRLRIRPEGLPCLSMTFSNIEDAKNWADKHEELYIENPKKYQSWIKENRSSKKRLGVFHIHIPLESFT